MLLLSKLNYRGDWCLLRAKFTNDWNFFVREVGRGNGMEERSLEIGEVCSNTIGYNINLYYNLLYKLVT